VQLSTKALDEIADRILRLDHENSVNDLTRLLAP
jgi:hypothetical protein